MEEAKLIKKENDLAEYELEETTKGAKEVNGKEYKSKKLKGVNQMNKIKFEIKNKWTGSILFEYEKENNTLKDTVEEAIKRGAKLADAYLKGAYLEDAYLKGADLRGANLEGANLEGANLEGANLKGADLEGAYLKGANLEGAYLKGANLEGADLEGADLRGANLEGANLEGANLEGADLEGADLRGANLEGANLGGAYLKGANLGGAYLKGADLEGADLKGVYMKVSDNEIDVNYIIKEFEENSNIEIIETYINKDIIPTRWNAFWNFGLIICNWKIKEKEVEEMTLSQICKELGRNIKIVKDNGGI